MTASRVGRIVNVHVWLFVPEGAVTPILTRSSSTARATGIARKFRHDRREAINRTSWAVSNSPGGSQRRSATNVAYVEAAGSRAFTVMASAGQTAAQWPQERERSPVTTAFPPCMDIVPAGQTRTHRPHPVHLSPSIRVDTVRSIIRLPGE